MHREFVDLLADNARHAERDDVRFEAVQDGQRPDAVSVCCADSRVLQDHLWGNDEPGHLFTVSNIGNRVLQHADGETVVSGDVLYPIEHTCTEVAVVVGHTGCGAITAAYEDLTDGRAELPGIAHCLAVLEPHLEDGIERLPDGLSRTAAVNRLVEYNVDRQVEALLASEPVPDVATVAGVVYDFQDVYGGRRGEIHVVNVDGERDVAALCEEYPEIDGRVERLWDY